MMPTHARRQARRLPLVCALAGSLALGVTACGGSSKKAATAGAVTGGGTGQASAKPAGNGGGGGIPGLPTDALCAKLPVADGQALIVPKLSAAIADGRLGGCTFLLPGNQIADSNLTVAYQTGSDAAERYKEDTNGTFSAGGQTVNVGDKVTTPLSGVGDKAVWGSTSGYPVISALKGSVYCNVSTTDDATKLAIIGSPNSPLPQGSQAQQLQYAQLEGKLCNDLFGLVH